MFVTLLIKIHFGNWVTVELHTRLNIYEQMFNTFLEYRVSYKFTEEAFTSAGFKRSCTFYNKTKWKSINTGTAA